MDPKQKSGANAIADLRKDITDNLPMLVSRAQLRDIITPMIDQLKQTVIDVMPIIPKRIDTEALTKDIAAAVKDSVEIKHETIENTVVQEVAVPAEIIELLKLQSHAITLLKNQPKDTSLDNYKPHDQAKKSGISFFGFADASGKWYILCQQGKKQRYAAGQTNYIAAWKQREEHKYTTLSEAMDG